VPLRVALWLVVPSLVGGILGVSIAKRPAAPATHTAAPRLAVVRHVPAAPPRRIYRPVHLRAGLVPLRGDAVVAQAVVQGTLASITGTPVPVNVDVVGFTPAREFAESGEGEQPTIETSFATSPTTNVPSEPIRITDVRTVSLSPSSATIAWRTSEPVASRIAYGLDSPTLWTADTAAALDHEAIVSGLTFSTSYKLWVTAHAEDGRTAGESYMLTTPALSGRATASVAGGAFRIDGEPTFPTIVWNACPDAIPHLLSIGIDLYMANGCGSAAQQAAVLGRRGFALSDALEAPDAASVGSFLPDEWDTHLPNDFSVAAAHTAAPYRGGGPRFLTLTNHFYSHAEPLPQGRGMYPALVESADVVGFDLYPLQNWCRFDDFGHVFDSQRELVQLAAGKPTFQWIETRKMDCRDPVLDPTPETVRAETWLAIAGGAHAIGYFPNDWNPIVDGEVARTKREIQALLPALLEPVTQAVANSAQLRVSARIHNGAVYVIAVNASRSPVTATITVPELGDRGVVSLSGDRAAVATAGAFADTFAPLEVRVYVAAPPAS
jgi:hypothetical protein